MSIDRADERRVHFRFIVGMTKLLSPGGARENRLEVTLILAAIALGELEKKPFRAAKLASFLGFPRATLSRRLDEIQQAGLIRQRADGAYLSTPETINTEEMDRLTERVSLLILQAAEDLRNIRGGGPKTKGGEEVPKMGTRKIDTCPG